MPISAVIHTQTQNLLRHALKVHQENDIDAAKKIYQEILSLNPNEPDALNLLGIIYFNNHQLDKALELHKSAISNKTGVTEFHNNLGNVYFEMRQLELALEQFNIAHQLAPEYAVVINNLGNIYQETNQLDKAISQYEKALSIEPGLVEASRNLAISLWKLNRQDEAEQKYNSAMKNQTKDVQYFHNMGNIYRSQGRFFEAEQAFNNGLALDPTNTQLNRDLGLFQLSQEKFKEGWINYSKGRVPTEKLTHACSQLSTPLWDGCSLENKTILIYGEQGIGDEIMFAQLIPEIARLTKQCIIACEARLAPLFSRSFENVKIISGYHNADELNNLIQQNAVDFTSLIGDLTKFLRPDTASFPKPTTYLKPSPEAVNKWKKRYQALGDGLKIGISWKGGVLSQSSTPRTTDLELWLNLFKLPNCHFINMQYGDQSQELRQLKERHGITLHHWEDSLPLLDMDDFAAQTAALDLIISIDNSTVHLAGAVGTPTWLLLPLAPDWRWGIQKQDSLWYANITFFHQRILNNWNPVFVEIINRLTTIQNNKNFLHYLAFEQLPTALFIHNCSAQKKWGETYANNAISQILNNLLLNVKNIFSNELSHFSLSTDKVSEIHTKEHLEHFCLSNPFLINQIKKTDHIIINGKDLLGSTEHDALVVLTIACIAKTLYSKQVYIINLSINSNLYKQNTVPNSIYQQLFKVLDGVSTQDSLSSSFLNQQQINHNACFSCIPLYIKNNYPQFSGEKINTIVFAGLDALADDVLVELTNYMSVIASNGFKITLLIEAQTENKPTTHFEQFLLSHPLSSEQNINITYAHAANTWLDCLATACLLISSESDYIIAASYLKTPCIVINDTLDNNYLTKHINIQPPLSINEPDISDRLIQCTLAILEDPKLFLPAPELNTLTQTPLTKSQVWKTAEPIYI